MSSDTHLTYPCGWQLFLCLPPTITPTQVGSLSGWSSDLSSRFPVAFRLLAFASWVVFSLLEISTFLTVGLLIRVQMYIRNPFRRHQGYHVPHQSRYEWGGCPLYPEAAVSTWPQ